MSSADWSSPAIAEPSRPWVATYRLQVHSGFTLAHAQKILPYLAQLGISHVYLSPCLQATPGSQHGYDVTDSSRVSDDIGGEAGWSSFIDATRRFGLRILLDIVPNHMAASEHNGWWDDVLAKGPHSRYANYFDIRVPAHEPFKVHLCTLGKPYGDSLEAGHLTIVIAGDWLRVKHFTNTWPLSASSIMYLLDQLTDQTSSGASSGDEDAAASITGQRLQQLQDQGKLAPLIDRVNADRGLLDQVLQRQFYILHGWKLAGEYTNYRRFFDVSGLVGMSTERPEVFDRTHARYKSMIERGEVDGLRVDHPDGLQEPLEYFHRLRELLPAGRIYVEKILDNEESLNTRWPIDGTVGYDFLAKANRLWMSEQRIDVLTSIYADFTGHSVNLGALIREKKDFIVGHAFANEHLRLADAAVAIARTSSTATRDLSARQIRDAVAQITAALGVYRTYRTAQSVDEDDRRVLSEAIRSARIAKSDIESATYDFFFDLMTKESLDPREAAFIAQWQQLTPAVMAKGVEDTTFYCFDRLLSCNEVGAQASLVGISSDKFHEYCHHLSEHWPLNQLATSTHDNKRSEDVRTRISLLSEMPDRWGEALHQWSQLNEAAWNNRTPDRHAEYLFYQTLVGAWPISAERCWQYMLKASREAKMRTSWQEPNIGYEENIKGFVERVLRSEEFLASLEAFVTPLIVPGRINSLAQTLIKMVAPGVPDFYQGTELWDLSLVDPDNRRPVDYLTREALLARCQDMSATEATQEWDSGTPKLWMIHRLLALRAARPEDFSSAGKYQPLVAQGAHLGHLLAFRRGDNVICVVPRLTASIEGKWGDTQLPLPGGYWRCVFTDQVFTGHGSPDSLFGKFPVALLVRSD